jgi:hypothetical protein
MRIPFSKKYRESGILNHREIRGIIRTKKAEAEKRVPARCLARMAGTLKESDPIIDMFYSKKRRKERINKLRIQRCANLAIPLLPSKTVKDSWIDAFKRITYTFKFWKAG